MLLKTPKNTFIATIMIRQRLQIICGIWQIGSMRRKPKVLILRIRHLRHPEESRMKRLTIILGSMLIGALLLTEAHSLLYKLNPSLADKQMNLFIKKHSFPISLEWY